VVVVGAGIAGLAAAIAFGRAGHHVTLVERDADPPPGAPGASFLGWNRPGVPQRRLERLFAAGAHDVDMLDPVVGREPRPGDEELFVLRCRRTVFEWTLRRVAGEMPAVTIAAGETVAGLSGRPPAGPRPAAVTGVRLRSGGSLAADLVVDAAGRQSKVARWLTELGAPAPIEETHRIGLTYFTRFYERQSEGFPVSAQVNLGYARATAVAADGRTFSLTFFVRAKEPEFRTLHRPAVFERAAAAVPGFGPWREGATPLGGVNVMGALDNRIHRLPGGAPPATGLIIIGDSLSHTDPTLGRGMSFALDHAFAAARLPWLPGPGLAESGARFHALASPLAEASYADAVATDRLSERLYRGDPEAPAEPRAALLLASPLAARFDQDLFRAITRNNGLLQPPGALIAEPWISRARALLAQNLPRPAGPSREEMIELLRSV